jgi:uncharacterized Tic20 family protein
MPLAGDAKMDDQHSHDTPPIQPAADDVSPAGVTKDDRTWGMLAHISAIVASALTGGTCGWLGPLIVWLMKKDESHFVDDQGKESLNFQITLIIAYVVCWSITVITCGLLFPVLFIPAIFQLVFCILAAIRANEGQYYRYPMTIRVIN